MRRLAEIQTDWACEGAWADEWTTIDQRGDGTVVFSREYIRPRDSKRRNSQDEGISIDIAHLSDVIEALQRAAVAPGPAPKEEP